jgi:hypothetical protein
MPEDLIVDDAVMRFQAELESGKGCVDGEERWYEEAMRYYLRRMATGSGVVPPGEIGQAEFDFELRICEHPALITLCELYKNGIINKYDLPILEPFARAVADGVGVKETELATIKRLIEKYERQ